MTASNVVIIIIIDDSVDFPLNQFINWSVYQM